MSDELTLDMAVERIGELVQIADKLNLNWKNELGRRVEAEAKIDASYAAGVAAERARAVALIEAEQLEWRSGTSHDDLLVHLLKQVRGE